MFLPLSSDFGLFKNVYINNILINSCSLKKIAKNVPGNFWLHLDYQHIRGCRMCCNSNLSVTYLISLLKCCTQICKQKLCSIAWEFMKHYHIWRTALCTLKYAAQCFPSIGLQLMLNIWKKTWKYICPQKLLSDCSLKSFPDSRVVTTTSGRSEVSEDQCAGHHWQLREDGCWWGFERCHCYLSDWLSDWSPQGAERSWGGGGALIVMRDRGEALKANQSHWLRAVGGAGASLEDNTSHCRARGVRMCDTHRRYDHRQTCAKV